MSELHLVVLWSNARAKEDEILEDVAARFSVVKSCVVDWPAPAVECFRMFYGVKLDSAEDKAESAGAGPFRLVVVRDDSPEYAVRETSRGLESVNVELFECKRRYREWTGGGHSVHTTNSEAETRHDLMLLTGHTLEEWKASPEIRPDPFPAVRGWRSLREVLAFLNETVRYVVLRNWEGLPDGFDPSLHGDIDLLVQDDEDCATLLRARKKYDEPERVHYVLPVGGRDVYFDFRHVGDGYYDESWEREILSNRRFDASGFYVPSAEDAFYSLVYHVMYQKPSVAADYPGKCRALSAAVGTDGDFDRYLLKLEDFLSAKRYSVIRPADRSVYFNKGLVQWRDIASRVAASFRIDDMRPFGIASWPDPDMRMTDFLLCGTRNGKPVLVKYAHDVAPTLADEYRMGRMVHERFPNVCPEPVFWHDAGDDRFFVQEIVAGTPLDAFIAECRDVQLMEKVAADLVDAVKAVNSIGILHRDIRPANILVRPDGTVCLIDFQFALDVSGGYRESWYLRSHPEVLMSIGADFRASENEICDAASLERCLRLFPGSRGIDAIVDEVSRWAAGSALRISVFRETWWQRRRRRRRQRYEKYGVNGFWGYAGAKIARIFGWK